MPDALLIQPDTKFIRDVMSCGGGDLKKCYQCGTCSVSCKLSPEEAPFPRKQILAAQWGLKDAVTADPALWLCHNCGECNTRCPRGARPGDVLGALRAQAVRRFAFPQFMGAVATNPKALPLMFLLPVLIFLGVFWQAPRPLPPGPLKFAYLFPIPTLEAVFYAVCGFAALALGVGLMRFTLALRAAGRDGETAHRLLPALGEIATHERFAQCEGKGWRIGHLLTMWGFGGLAIVGASAGIGTMAGVVHTPLALNNPLKVFANVAAAVTLAGVLMLLARRGGDSARRRSSAYFDWFFIHTLAGVVITGILCEALRLAQTHLMYTVYFVHLVLVFVLLLYAPYSKFAHLAYRTVTLAISTKSQRRTHRGNGIVANHGKHKTEQSEHLRI